MGTEILILIVIPGLAALIWLVQKILFGVRIDAVVCLSALIAGLGLGVRGMVNSYRPDFPENWNTSFLMGWFLMSASFWLIVLASAGAIVLYLVRKLYPRNRAERKGAHET